MSHNTFFKEEMELDQIRETEQHLAKRERESAEHRRRLAQQRSERETTMPPLEEVQDRKQRKQHEQIVSRGEVKNERRTQNYSMLLLVLLVAATCSLVWWGMRLMQGG